jgi:hypothetical protein
MRFSKQKGGTGALEAHHERTKAKYASNPDIDTTRSKHNFHIIKPKDRWRQEVDSRITAAGCKTRKDSVRFVDTLITASPDFFKGKKREEVTAYFKRVADFLARKIGKGNIFTAIVHMDEKTPHMHLCFTPITEDGRLTAKDIIGNRPQLVKWQDVFWSHMVKGFPDLERGESASIIGRKHIPTRVYKQAARLTKQKEKIQTVLENINPLNAGKKRDEAVSLLQKFFPDMENLETRTRRYKREFDRQERENAELTKKLNAAKPSIIDQLARGNLQIEVQDLRRFYNAVPDDIRREVEASMRQPRQHGRGRDI